MQRQALEAMRAAGIRPILAYAYRRTGWIVSDLKLLTPEERQEYEEVCDEFDIAVANGTDPDQLGYPDTVEEVLLDHLLKTHIVGGYFIENHFNNYRRTSRQFDNVETVSASCTINFVRCLKSVHALLSQELSYDAYNLLRSMYENYLTTKYVYEHHQDSASFLAQLGTQIGTHEYAVGKSGDPIQSKILDKTTGETFIVPSRWQMANKLENIDREMYNELYRSFSSFSHSDIGNLAFFLKDGKFDYHNQDFTVDALIKCHLLCLLMFGCLKRSSSCRKYLRNDLDFLCQRIFSILLVAIRFLEEVEGKRLPDIGWSIVHSVAGDSPKLQKLLDAAKRTAG
jgi:hypothetical protein